MSMLKRLKKRLPHEKEEHITVKRTDAGKAQLVTTHTDFKEKMPKKKTINQAAKEFKKQEAIKKKAERARRNAEIRKAIKYVQGTARKTQTGTGELLTMQMLGAGSKNKVSTKGSKSKYVIVKGKAYPIAKTSKKKKKNNDNSFNWGSFKMPEWGELFK